MKNLARATATPLASIFGSGFLVIVPILNGAVGPWAWVAMTIVCLVAFAVGSVIRFNIATAEPLLDSGQAPQRTRNLERCSDIALIAAYIISVCLYINILASFLLGGIDSDLDTVVNEHLVSVAVIVVIGFIGYRWGLETLAKLETVALAITLLIILALIAGFATYDWRVWQADAIQWPVTPGHSVWTTLTIVAGTLIVVQGFETSRYLASEFDSNTRIQSCRWSQLISSAVYLVFVALATPLMHFLGETVEDNALIMLAGKASVLLPIPLVIAAILSQFSAAVADTLGGAGTAEEASNHHISSRLATVLICSGAVVLCMAPTLTILALASRAFAFYYLMQCLVAISVSQTSRQQWRFGAIGLILLFITLFAVPAG